MSDMLSWQGSPWWSQVVEKQKGKWQNTERPDMAAGLRIPCSPKNYLLLQDGTQSMRLSQNLFTRVELEILPCGHSKGERSRWKTRNQLPEQPTEVSGIRQMLNVCPFLPQIKQLLHEVAIFSTATLSYILLRRTGKGYW